jgi:hypothetical protein
MLPEEELKQPEEAIGNSNPRNLNKSQKIMAASLAFFAMAILVLWSVQFKKTISGSLNGSGAATADQLSQEAMPEDNTAVLKVKDTDKDGLNDYDELNIYKTSPYLEDSDSDGIGDKKEMDAGADPNCPEGRSCNGNLQNAAASGAGESAPSDSLKSMLDSLDTSGAAPAPIITDTAGTNPILTDDIDAAALRQLLIQQGIDKAVLDKISDADLMASFEETLQK